MPVIAQPASRKDITAQPNEFGAAPKDANKAPIGATSFIQTNDATPVDNLVSPLAVTDAVTTALVTPINAVTVTIISSAPVRVSEQADMSSHFLLPADTPITLDVARQGAVYLRAPAAGTPSVSFLYQTL